MACERATIKNNELLAAQQEYNDLKESIDRPMEETQEPAPPPAPPVGSNPGDVPVDLNEQESDMDLNNPGIEEEDDGVVPAVKRKRLTHFDQMMAGLSHFDNEMLASFLGHVQAYSEQQNAIAQEVVVASYGGVRTTTTTTTTTTQAVFHKSCLSQCDIFAKIASCGRPRWLNTLVPP